MPIKPSIDKHLEKSSLSPAEKAQLTRKFMDMINAAETANCHLSLGDTLDMMSADGGDVATFMGCLQTCSRNQWP